MQDADHDPYCKAHHPDILPVDHCAWCSVIKRVRAEEQKKSKVEQLRFYDNGYRDGYKDCQNDSAGYEKLAKDREATRQAYYSKKDFDDLYSYLDEEILREP